MTKITIYKTKSGSYQRFSCLGHAGYSKHPSEKDMVCASVSVLVINTVNAIDSLTKVKMSVSQEEETGWMDVQFPDAIDADAKLLIDAMILGLTSIEKQYGSKYVTVIIKEV